jgi:glutamate racemase
MPGSPASGADEAGADATCDDGPEMSDGKGSGRPIGIFDSGVGGLSVMREIREELPHEDLLYAADSGHAPYGDKRAVFVQQRALAMADFLVQQNAKAIVVACNTATGVAVDALRARWTLPIIAVEPAIKPAASLTKSGVVGVLATSQTIASTKFTRLVDRFGVNVEILAQACPGLAELVERGEVSSDATRLLVEQYVAPLLHKGADTLVLGCTHYPFVIDAIRSIAGPQVEIVDPARAVAKEVRRRLEDRDLLTTAADAGTIRVWTSGSPGLLHDVVARLGFADLDVCALDR